jgi:hypothetical protein
MVRNKLCLVLSCLAIILFPVKSQSNQCSLCPVGKYKTSTSNSFCVNCPAHSKSSGSNAKNWADSLVKVGRKDSMILKYTFQGHQE